MSKLTAVQQSILVSLVELGSRPHDVTSTEAQKQLIDLGYAALVVGKLDSTLLAATPVGRAVYCDLFQARTATLARSKRLAPNPFEEVEG